MADFWSAYYDALKYQAQSANYIASNPTNTDVVAANTYNASQSASAPTSTNASPAIVASEQMNDVRNAGRAASMQTGLTGNLLSGESGFEEDPFNTSKLLLGQ